MAIGLGIVGIGKIARDQHLPVVAASDAFELIAVASRHATVDGVRTFTSLAAMLAGAPEIQAVVLCTPPAVRFADARLALSRGRHVLLEKPPGATLSEVHTLAGLAGAGGTTLYASWHSRHAAAVEPARTWLARRTVRSVEIVWKEDVRVWHPGQEWIFEPGGLGVFDPFINALSIATRILPRPFALQRARLAFPENRQAPTAAELTFTDVDGAPIGASVDCLHSGPHIWDIHVETDAGRLDLLHGGAAMHIDGVAVALEGGEKPHLEYEGVYARFAALIAGATSDADIAPLRHVADAFLIGERVIAPPFHF